MAASHFGPTTNEENPDTFSIFVQGYEKGIPANLVKQYSDRIGYPVNATQYPNGFTIDINTGDPSLPRPTEEKIRAANDATFSARIRTSK